MYNKALRLRTISSWTFPFWFLLSFYLCLPLLTFVTSRSLHISNASLPYSSFLSPPVQTNSKHVLIASNTFWFRPFLWSGKTLQDLLLCVSQLSLALSDSWLLNLSPCIHPLPTLFTHMLSSVFSTMTQGSMDGVAPSLILTQSAGAVPI